MAITATALVLDKLRLQIPKDINPQSTINQHLPTVRDRVVQQALLNVLQPIFDPHFHIILNVRKQRTNKGEIALSTFLPATFVQKKSNISLIIMSNILKGIENALKVVSTARAKIGSVKPATQQKKIEGINWIYDPEKPSQSQNLIADMHPRSSQTTQSSSSNETTPQITNGGSNRVGEIVTTTSGAKPNIQIGPLTFGVSGTAESSIQQVQNMDGTVTISAQTVLASGGGVRYDGDNLNFGGGVENRIDYNVVEITSKPEDTQNIINNLQSDNGLDISTLPSGAAITIIGEEGIQDYGARTSVDVNLNVDANAGPILTVGASGGAQSPVLYVEDVPITTIERGANSTVVGTGQTTIREEGVTSSMSMNAAMQIRPNGFEMPGADVNSNIDTFGGNLQTEATIVNTNQVTNTTEINYSNTEQGEADAQSNLNTGKPILQEDGTYVENVTETNTNATILTPIDASFEISSLSNNETTQNITNLEQETMSNRTQFRSEDSFIGNSDDEQTGASRQTHSVFESEEDGQQGFQVTQNTRTLSETGLPNISQVDVQLQDGSSLNATPEQIQSYAQEALNNGSTNPIIEDLAEGSSLPEAIVDDQPFMSNLLGLSHDNENSVEAIQELQELQDNDTSHADEPNSNIISSSNTDSQTGVTTRVEGNINDGTVTVSTPDTDAASSPITNEVNTYDENGVTSTETTVTSPTGGTYSASDNSTTDTTTTNNSGQPDDHKSSVDEAQENSNNAGNNNSNDEEEEETPSDHSDAHNF